jgi:hypothetical protein
MLSSNNDSLSKYGRATRNPYTRKQHLFGLATPKVYYAFVVTNKAVSSYLTFSPLPTARRFVFCSTICLISSFLLRAFLSEVGCSVLLGLSSQAEIHLSDKLACLYGICTYFYLSNERKKRFHRILSNPFLAGSRENKTIVAFPARWSSGKNPQKRESTELSLLSPITK